MKKSFLIYGLIALGAIATIALLPKGKSVGQLVENQLSSVSCDKICSHLKDVCNEDLIASDDCPTVCGTWSDEIKQMFLTMNDCEFLKAQIEGQAQVLAEEMVNKNNPNATKCDQACNNYVTRCLSLVPNASAELFEQGFDSCKGECAAWAVSKIECMIKANTCEAFTDTCGL